MAERPRIALAPCPAHMSLLQYWAALQGRPVADLVLVLVERGIEEALQTGRVPRMAVELMETEMQAREAACIRRHGQLMLDMAESERDELNSFWPQGKGDVDDSALLYAGGPGKAIGYYSAGNHHAQNSSTTKTKKEAK